MLADTDRQTDRQTDCNTPLPYRDGYTAYIWSERDHVIRGRHRSQTTAEQHHTTNLPRPQQAGLLFKSPIEPDLRVGYAPLLGGRRRFEHRRRTQTTMYIQ